ncbi:glycoside hydrolase family 13 protein [Tepidibacillus decaturensis]|uniref:Alpha-glycosidase n=1 Tax=Tepidibacillus decaturensis TaxID=1413211 RepID=A0A135L606_9BACI|nr:glycoside hydrolase family 13 protein [Tepidibacillus decaturensis]KXG44401.1 alpha-glycosidase [Tepidibacillus decaturensis]
MLLESIFHQPYGSFAFPIDGHTLRIRIRAKKGDVEQVTVLHGDRYQPIEHDVPLRMKKVASDDLFDYFSCDLPSKTRRIRYTFYLEANGSGVWYGDKGIANERVAVGDFQFPFINEQDLFEVPEWVKKGIVYQIFPERFANGNTKNDPENVEPWGGKPTPHNFFGGDLEGMIEKLPYLDDLGVNVIYMTPVFESPSNHKYNTTDYYKIDPHFGDLDTVKKLVKESHKRGIKVIFDAVFNHCGYDFFAFQDVVKNGEKSKYKDWFYIESFPIVTEPHPNYETFANDVWTMPKLKTSNPEVKEYLLNVARYWIEEAGIDGWRLDVANEVDHDFWRAFRKVVREANPEALIIGEIWHDSAPWLEGDQYDSVMNYLFREAIFDFFARRNIGVSTLDARLAKARMKYRDQANYAMFNLIDSHDTERFLTSVGEKEELLRLAALFQMTYIGMPMVYYGTEIGMTGKNDPDCRKTFVWDEKEQNRDLFDYYKKLIQIRKSNLELTHGDVETVLIDEINQVYAFARNYEGKSAVVVINSLQKEQEVEIPVAKKTGKVKDLLTKETYPVKDGKVKVKLTGYQGVILK